MPFYFYKQRDRMDCGPACLLMVAKHYGKSVSIQYLRDKSQIGKQGATLLGISEAAEALGFRSIAVKTDYTTLTKDAKLPCILYWKQNHFMVLYKIKKPSLFSRNELLYVADPARGLWTCTSEEFRAGWICSRTGQTEEGIALLVDPTPALYQSSGQEGDKYQSQKGIGFKSIFNYLTPYTKLVFQLLLGLGVSTILQLILPFLTQSIVDTGINTANIHFIYVILLAQLALFAGRLFVEFIRSWILLHISSRINISILTDFLIKLLKLPISYFDSKLTGDLLQRMNDHKRIESFLTGSSLNTLFSLVNLVIFSIVLAVYNINIFIVFITASLLYSAWVILFLKKRRKLDYMRFEIAAKEQGATIQIIQGIQEIKLHNIEKSMRWNWEKLQVKLFGLNIKNLTLTQSQQIGAFFINEGKNIIITFLSAKAVIDGQITLGAMLAIQYIIGQLNSPIEQLVGFIQSWQNARISMDRLNEIHQIEDEEAQDTELLYQLPVQFTKQLAGGKNMDYVEPLALNEEINSIHHTYSNSAPAPEQPAIIFKNASFTYPGAGNEPVLKNINLSIPQGKTTAIVGVSGSGKTTLLKLLLRFYDPQAGEIKLGNTPLKNISHKTWRSHCGVVMQESFIFSDTIARNIAVGAERINMDKLYQAVEVANIRDYIESLPLAFNTKIGMEGTGISMGIKQRLLIARAVYRNPAFIFFDEATNSLDAINESVIIHHLQSFFQNRTVIIVAHRLSTVKNADQIVVLNNSEVVEKGTHSELIALKGYYFTLVKNQLELGT